MRRGRRLGFVPCHGDSSAGVGGVRRLVEGVKLVVEVGDGELCRVDLCVVPRGIEFAVALEHLEDGFGFGEFGFDLLACHWDVSLFLRGLVGNLVLSSANTTSGALVMSNEKSKTKKRVASGHGGPRPNSGRPKGRTVQTFAIVARPEDHARWQECARAEGIALSKWIAERCGDVTGPSLSRMHERIVSLCEETGADVGEALAEWRLLAAAWLERSKGETKDVRDRLAGLEGVP